MTTLPSTRRVRGDTWNIPALIKKTDPATGITAPATDLAVCTIVSTIRSKGSDVLLWTGTKAAGNITLLGSGDGKINVKVPAGTTATAKRKVYKMDVEVTLTATGDVTTPLILLILVDDAVTVP